MLIVCFVHSETSTGPILYISDEPVFGELGIHE